MTGDVTSYKCPGCSAPLSFSPETGSIWCNNCETSYTASELSVEVGRTQQKEWREEDVDGSMDDNGEKMLTLTCPSCGAELACEPQTISTKCPYCDNNIIANEQVRGTLRPDYIIPFGITEKHAVEAFRKFYWKKPLTPSRFRKENKVSNIKGLYVPFWLFSGRADASVEFEASTSTSRSVSSSKTVVTTKIYKVDMKGEVPFQKVPIDASSRLYNDQMEDIEPYDYGRMCEFDAAYMSGYPAQKFNLSEEECLSFARGRVSEELGNLLKEQVTGYDSVSLLRNQCKVDSSKIEYAFFPVYTLSVSWNGKKYDIMVNGQTGKVSGEIPYSKVKVAVVAVLCLILHGLIFLIISYLSYLWNIRR